MYQKDRRRTAALYIGGGLAFVLCLGVIVFLIWSMAMKNSYRDLCLEINDAILAAPAGSCTIGRGENEYPADADTLDYYDRFLLAERVMPYSRRPVPADDRTIILSIGADRQLLLTGIEGDTAVNLRWITPEGEQSYTVRATTVSFSQLSAYYANLSRRGTQ